MRSNAGTFAAGSEMFAACNSCHAKYIRRPRETPKPLPDLPPDLKATPIR